MLTLSRRWTSLALTALTLATSAHAAVAPAASTANTASAPTANTAAASVKKSTKSAASKSTNSSVASASASAPSFFSNVGVSYLGMFAGPSLSKVNSMYQDEAQTSPIGLTNRITVSKGLGGDVSLAAAIQATTKTAQGTVMNDPYLKLSKGSLYSKGNYNLSGDFRIKAGLSSDSMKNGKLGVVQLTQNQDYQFGTSRFSASMQTVQAVAIYNDFAGKTVGHVEAYPALAFTLNPRIALSAGSTIASDYKIGSGFSSVAYDMDIGGDITISKNITFSPSVNVTPQTGITLESSTINAALSWKLL